MNRESVDWRGYIPAVTTPFTAGLELDRDGWRAQLDWLLAERMHGIAVAGTVGKIDQFNYVTTLVITPLFLVAGTFFPINQLPEAFQVLAQFNPLYQLVELVRGAAFGFEAVDVLRVLALLAFGFAMWRLAVRQMTRRLVD